MLNLNRKDLWTIPNLLSLSRILMIPVIIWLYVTKNLYYIAFGVVALSGLTDFLDGIIARKFNKITDLGKVLDPFADKLTQAALIICLCTRYRWMWALISLFVVKELVSAALAYLSLQASGQVSGAQWYGKVNTALLYAVMIFLILFPNIPLSLANTLIAVTAASLSIAFALYVHFFWAMVLQGLERLKGNLSFSSVLKVIFTCLWLLLMLFCLVYRDKFTTEAILGFIPRNSWIAALCMLALFAFKSIAVFIYAGILYAANGLLFSLPVALLMSFLGSVIMFSTPYLMARFGVSRDVKKLAEKYPNVSFLQGFPSENKFVLNFIARIIGILPIDVVSLYMGTVRADFVQFLLGSLAGMAVSMTTFTVMGTHVKDLSSPAFVIALVVEIAVNVISLALFTWYKHRQRKKTAA